jgi:hypothetical protein
MAGLIFEQVLRITPPVPEGVLVRRIEEASVEVTDPAEAAAIVEEIEKELKKEIVVVLTVATLAGGYKRASAVQEAIAWIREQVGPENVEEAEDSGDLPADLGISFMVLRSVADVIGCLVPDKCENFDVPENLIDWLQVPDYLLSPMIDTAWRLNPHWTQGFDNLKN